MEYEESYDLEKIVNDPETIMEENKEFADQCYEEDNGQIYLQEKFIVHVIN